MKSMLLVDILARGLTAWPEGLECLSQQKGSGYIINGKGFDGRAFDSLPIADETRIAGAIVTRGEWQAAVDALNAGKVVEWDGEGIPPVGTVCEVLWNESRMEYLLSKVFGVNEHGQPIHRFEDGPKKYQYQADVLVTASGTRVFRPIRTPEQIAAEERSKAIDDMVGALGMDEPGTSEYIRCGLIYDAGFRKQVTK